MTSYSISVGQSRTSTAWTNKSTSWEKLTGRLGKCKHTPETVEEYKAMTKTEQGKAKDVGGFVGGVIRDGGRRIGANIVSRSLITLDIDHPAAGTLSLVTELLDGTAWCLYSTHSHRPDHPRFRLILPLSRDVTPDEYIPIARRVADDLGMEIFDNSTYEPVRLMYWPSCPKDGEFVFRQGEGEPVDADKILDSYTDWRNVMEWPSAPDDRPAAKKAGAKQEDPTEKNGIIGAFCRAYSITEAIEAFLSDVYVPTGHPDRWTYAQGSTVGGVVIYDDKWAYSHHGTDPCCEKLVNAFDMVRLHKFGDQDRDSDFNTPVNRLPSFLAMEKLVAADEKVRRQSIQEDFSDIQLEEDDWRFKLQKDPKGKWLANPVNFGLIVRNDPGLKGAVVNNLFSGRTELTRDLPWRKREAGRENWENDDYNLLLEYVCANYAGLTGKQAIIDAFDGAVSQNTTHPVREYLSALRWDGTPRLDTVLIDYLGAADNELTRAMTRKHLAAAVARVMQPSRKYDYVLTLIGPEGSGKSTLVRVMAKDKWFNDSLTSIEGKEAMEQLRGKWLIEMGELTNYKRSTSEAYKAFISKQDDSFRPAYGRKTEVYPRQCVFFATTNEDNFLKGNTGNRRFWVVKCSEDLALKDIWKELPGEVDQIWAEAVVRWREGEELYLNATMEAEARLRQNEHNELAADERAGLIDAYIHKEIPTTWSSMTKEQRQAWIQSSSSTVSEEPRMKRETVCAVEILVECFGQKTDENTRYRTKDINYILQNMDCLEYVGNTRDSVYGKQRRYRILHDPE